MDNSDEGKGHTCPYDYREMVAVVSLLLLAIGRAFETLAHDGGDEGIPGGPQVREGLRAANRLSNKREESTTYERVLGKWVTRFPNWIAHTLKEQNVLDGMPGWEFKGLVYVEKDRAPQDFVLTLSYLGTLVVIPANCKAVRDPHACNTGGQGMWAAVRKQGGDYFFWVFRKTLDTAPNTLVSDVRVLSLLCLPRGSLVPNPHQSSPQLNFLTAEQDEPASWIDAKTRLDAELAIALPRGGRKHLQHEFARVSRQLQKVEAKDVSLLAKVAALEGELKASQKRERAAQCQLQKVEAKDMSLLAKVAALKSELKASQKSGRESRRRAQRAEAKLVGANAEKAAAIRTIATQGTKLRALSLTVADLSRSPQRHRH